MYKNDCYDTVSAISVSVVLYYAISISNCWETSWWASLLRKGDWMIVVQIVWLSGIAEWKQQMKAGFFCVLFLVFLADL